MMARDSRDSKETVKAVIAIIVILLAVGFIAFFIHGKRSNPALSRDREVLAIDSITGKKYILIKKKDEEWPLINPDTKTDTLWPALICYKEKILFPNTANTSAMSCPFCSSGGVGAATVNEEDLEVKLVQE